MNQSKTRGWIHGSERRPMLDDKDIDKLCHGRIVLANVYNSSGEDAAGPHYCVILNTDETIKAKDEYTVACISTKTTVKEFLVPAPRHAGLTGNIVCSWIQRIALPGIIKVTPHKLFDLEMKKVMQEIRAAQAVRAQKSGNS
jgi:mRNA-degrading endonuclease toxin of MazEF toxin-antitoxin module